MRLALPLTKLTALLVAAFALTLAPAAAQDKTGLAASLKPFVDSKTLAGAVTLVATKDRILVVDAVGYKDIELMSLMDPNALFWIASMTKPITATALMMLLDEGKLKLDDPVAMYLPEFKNQMLVTEKGKDQKGNDQVVLKKPARPITVKDILTHTSGLCLKSPLEAPADSLTLREHVHAYALAPLEYQPGSKYQYNNPGINTAGRLIEVISKMPYEEFLQKRLFGPLGMKDTTFVPSEAQLKRLARSYKATPKGLEAIPVSAFTYPLSRKERSPMPAGGLFSTASDVATFCQMILNGGQFKGQRFLSEKTVQLMTTKQTGDLKAGGEGSGYGLGWMTNDTASHTFGHGGAYNTWMWIDPQRERVFVLMVQHSNFAGKEGPKVRSTFHTTALERFGK